LWLDGLTILVIAALKAAEPDVPVPPPPLLPPPQAARASAASPADTASQILLCLFKRTASRRVLVAGRTGFYHLQFLGSKCATGSRHPAASISRNKTWARDAPVR
jgi:hypothetical protein